MGGSVFTSTRKSQNIIDLERHNRRRTSNRSRSTHNKDLLIYTNNLLNSKLQNNFNPGLNSTFDILLRSRKTTYKGLLSADEEKKYGKLVQQLMKIEAAEQCILDNKGRYPTTEELANLFNMDTKSFVKLRTICTEAYR